MDVFSTKFAHDIFIQKYSKDKVETWADTSKRVVESVCSQLLDTKTKEKLYKYILERKFIPGGRYLYSAGREFHQISNCFLFRAEDSREGWADLMQKATASLMTGGGIGVDYSDLRGRGAIIKRTGGQSTGPIATMEMVNELGRHIMQGGSRRSAIWAGLNWKHSDAEQFLRLKDWSSDLKSLKEKDLEFRLPMELTNISIIYDTSFFIAIENEEHPQHEYAKKIWLANCKQAFSTAEPGMSFNFRKDRESLRNACVVGETEILTRDGYKQIQNLVNEKTEIWNGFEWSTVIPKITGHDEKIYTVTFSDGRQLTCTGYHKFHIATNYNGGSRIIEAKDLVEGTKLIKHNFPIIEHGEEYDYAYDQGFISAEGQDGYNFVWVYEPKYMCMNRLTGKAYKEYKGRRQFRFNHKPLLKSFVPFNWNLRCKLEWLAGLFDGDGTELIEGGLQLCSVNYNFLLNVQKLVSMLGIQSKVIVANTARRTLMPDGRGVQKEYDCLPSWRICLGAVQMQELKRLGLKCERMSFDKQPQRDASQFVRVIDIVEAGVAETVYCFNEPKKHLGIFNGILTGQCCEIVSEDDSDKCNLGTVWLNRIKDKKELADVVKHATMFLLCGGIYSDVPTDKIREIGNKNNRIGLGLGGIHEWLMQRKHDYECVPELHKWLSIYETESDSAAFMGAKQLSVSVPKGVRSIAPTGSIGILAESSTGIEPLFCKAYKRRYFKDNTWVYQYVVDGSVKRLLDQGVKLDNIKDSYDLTFKQRVKFQADVQNYVDMSISSTCNIAAWGSDTNNESTYEKNADILLKYAKRLRGFTVYPDGSRGGQPLTAVPLEEALKDEGKVFEETENECVGGICGL